MIVSKLDLERALCKKSYKYFVKEFWDTVPNAQPLQWNWHMDILCDELEALAFRVAAGLPKLYDLIINISPGTSKSSLMSILFHPWTWTFMPQARHINMSHTDGLVLTLAKNAREVINSEKYKQYFPFIRMRADLDAAGHYGNTLGGERFSCTIGGKAATGHHGHFVFGDDLIDPMKAESELELDTANKTWDQMPSRRILPYGGQSAMVSVMALCMQRVHQDDPTQRMLNWYDKPEDVRRITLPATLTADVYPKELNKWYDKDKFMDARRLGKKHLDEQLKRLGQYGFAAQYMQNPIPLGGGMFHVDDLRIGQLPPSQFKYVLRYWDKAGTDKGGAWTVGCKMAEDHQGRIWILDVKRGQWDSFRREEIVKQTANLDGKGVFVIFEQEPGSGGKESAEHSVRNLPGFRIRVHKVGASDGSKVTRADPFSSQVNGGNVYLAEGGWHSTFIDEMKHFPFSRYKDQIDAASGGYAYLSRKRIEIGAMK